jgi:hypothetical protein
MRISRPLAAVGLAGAFALAAPAGLAYAESKPQPRATGQFLYWNRNDGQQALVNPPNDRCLSIDAQNVAGPISNLTDRDAYVFTLPNCNGAVFKVFAHSTTYVPFADTRSVLFPVD